MCEGAVLPVLAGLLQDEDVEVQTNAAGVLMYTAILTGGTDTQTLRFQTVSEVDTI